MGKRSIGRGAARLLLGVAASGLAIGATLAQPAAPSSSPFPDWLRGRWSDDCAGNGGFLLDTGSMSAADRPGSAEASYDVNEERVVITIGRTVMPDPAGPPPGSVITFRRAGSQLVLAGMVDPTRPGIAVPEVTVRRCP